MHMTFQEFKEFNTNMGFHFFDAETMRYFNSKIIDSVWNEETGHFITSERPPDGERAYTIRKADFKTGQIHTIGEFMGYRSLAHAKRALRVGLKFGLIERGA